MISIISRNDPDKHPIISNIYNCLERISKKPLLSKAIHQKFGIRFYLSQKNYLDSKYIVVDDPIAYIYARYFLCIPSKKIILYSLEMYEFQVKNSSIRNRARNAFFKFFHKMALKNADKVIFPSKLRANHYSSIRKNNTYIIYNYLLEEDLKAEIPEKNLLNSLNDFIKQKKPLAIYAGSFQDGRGLNEFINIANKNRNINFLLVGVQENYNKSAIPKNVLILGKQPRTVVNYLYQKASIGLLFYENAPLNTKLCAPVKIWEYMYFNLNIIGNNNFALKNEWNHLVDGFLEQDYIINLNMKKSSHKTISFYEEAFLDFLVKINCYEL